MDKKLINATYLVKDMIQGDSTIDDREDFESLTGEDIRQAVKLIVENGNFSEAQKKYFLENTWRIHYKTKPPFMDEFLTTKYLGPTALSIYPHVKKVLIDFWHPLSEYRHLLLATSIGFGKSTLSALSALYIITHLALMKNPKAYLYQSEAASLVIALISFSMKKATQLLVKPFYNILITSSFFHRVKQEEYLDKRQMEYGTEKVCWTSASKMEGAFQFTNDLHILTASDPANLLGLTMIQAIMSELSFFIDRGIAPDTINRVYNDAKGRIFSRFGYRYFATTIMDSSPNDYNLPIDNYVFSGKAEKEIDDFGIRRNMVVTGAHWEQDSFKTLYPRWMQTGRTFPVFRGTSGKPPEILNEERRELKNYNANEIYHVPIDLRQQFEKDIKKMVKDYCGWPAGGDGRLIDNFNTIEDMFYDHLSNVYTSIKAPASKSPEKLIWDKIYSDFFIKTGSNYEFYRAPRQPRSIHLDLSESGDMSGISMAHMELDEHGQTVVVVDFTLALSTQNVRINLDAIPLFLLDLAKVGKVPIFKITADRYGSPQIIQRMKREGFTSEKLSVDKDLAPYHILVSWMKNNRIKVGRNIFLKNNLKSLIEMTSDKGNKKIDHQKGKIVYDDIGDWDSSQMGINAKDVSDSLCGAAYSLITEYKSIPSYQWIEEPNKKDNETESALKKELLNKVNEKFGLIVG